MLAAGGAGQSGTAKGGSKGGGKGGGKGEGGGGGKGGGGGGGRGGGGGDDAEDEAPTTTLSGGHRQLLALSRLLLHRATAKLVLLDEPAAGMEVRLLLSASECF